MNHPRDPRDDLPALYGGDGLSLQSPVVVNCCSFEMAQHLVEKFISERHGKAGKDWKMELESSASDTNQLNAPILRCVGVRLADGSTREYYFDRSRARETLMNFMKWAERRNEHRFFLRFKKLVTTVRLFFTRSTSPNKK